MAYPLIKLMQEELAQTGLTVDDVDRLMGIIHSIFGIDWIDKHKDKQKNTSPFEQHPVLIGCTGGSFESLMELFELTTYLLSFKDSEKLPKLILDLKQLGSYGDTFFQLAMAYRFKKLGFNVEA